MILAFVFQMAAYGAPAALTSIPTPPAQTAPATTTVASSVSSTQPSNQKICKTEQITGSRIGGFRVCMTKAEWDAKAASDGGVLNSLQMSGRTSGIQ